MQHLPLSLQSYASHDRVDSLCAGLSAARLHTVAKAVRDQRSSLAVPSHQLYMQPLAARTVPFSPIYPTAKGQHGARRCSIDKMQANAANKRSSTPAALYSSPNLLKQFAESPTLSMRPRTASAAASRRVVENARNGSLDAATNHALYERHRAVGRGWPPPASVGTCAPPPAEILDVEAEQRAAPPPAAEDITDAPYVFGTLLREAATAEEAAEEAAKEAEQAVAAASAEAAGGMEAGAFAAPASPHTTSAMPDEEVTPPGASAPWPLHDVDKARLLLGGAAPPDTAGMRPTSSRRTLNMLDAAAYYERASALPAQPPPPPPVPPPAPRLSVSRQRAHEMLRGHDIFGGGAPHAALRS
jgi:hypothetical protein